MSLYLARATHQRNAYVPPTLYEQGVVVLLCIGVNFLCCGLLKKLTIDNRQVRENRRQRPQSGQQLQAEMHLGQPNNITVNTAIPLLEADAQELPIATAVQDFGQPLANIPKASYVDPATKQPVDVDVQL